MFGRRLVLGWAAVFALGGGLAPTVVRAADEATEKTFLAGLERARGLLATGKAAEGLKFTNELLTTHEGRDYVRAKRADVEDLVKRLSFSVRCPAPAPKDVVKGKLVSYSGNPTRVKIVCEPKHHDFEERAGRFSFPADFAGPYSIQVRGRSYPRKSADSPRVLVGMEEDAQTGQVTSWQILFGTPSSTEKDSERSMPAKILRCVGKDEEVLLEKEVSSVKLGAAFKLDVDVGTSRIAASLNGKAIGACPKPAGVFGQLAFECRGWEEATIEGAIEPSWIQGRIDEIVHANLVTFEKGFEVRTMLPAWLYAGVPAGVTPAPGAGEPDADLGAWPVEIPKQHRLAVTQIMFACSTERFHIALDLVGDLRKARAPDVLCTYLMAYVRYGQGDYTAALADLDRTLQLAPGFGEALQLRGMTLGRLGREAEVEAAFRAAIAASPNDVELVVSATIALLLVGRSDASHAVLEDAARRGLSGASLDALGRILIKVTRGPDWAKSFEVKTPNYHVMSDIDVETCRQAGKVLEEALAAFKANLESVDQASARQFRVFLFRGRAGFLNYLEDTSLFGGARGEGAAGVYVPHLKQLCIWNLPSREEMMRTVRHEGFHQYMDRLLPDTPAWLNEGLAVYYENMGQGSGPKFGGVQHDQLRTLEEKRMTSAADYLFQSHREFMLHPERSYAQAWLVVHMLRHGTAAQKELFKDLITRLKTQTPYDALRAVFTPERVGQLDAQWKQHAESLAAAK